MNITNQNKIFWKNKANLLKWEKIPNKIFQKKNNHPLWYSDGKIDIYQNLISRNVKLNPKKIAIITVNKNNEIKNYSYQEIDLLVNSFLNKLYLKKKIIKKMMIHASASIDSAISMLACCKRGIFFSVIFEDLPYGAIKTRIKLFKPDTFITRSKKLYKNLNNEKQVKKIEIFNFDKLNKIQIRKIKIIKNKILKSNDNFFCLFTSGSTGVPKGIIHNYGGYTVYTKFTCQRQFGMNSKSIVLTASDAGWINGHTYSLFGPLLFGSTTILCENPILLLNEKLLKSLIKLGVTILYFPVTIIRLLKATSNKEKFKPNKIISIGSMGEPLAPSVGLWFAKKFKTEYSAIVNTYFQTETGGIIASPKYTDNSKLNPHGSIGQLACNKLKLDKLEANNKHEIIIQQPWPGCMKNTLNEKKDWFKYWNKNNHFKMFDLGTKKKGTLFVHGRIDDVINIRGHRIGSEELESIVLKNKLVAECCAIASSDEIEGSIFYLFLVAKKKIDNDQVNKMISKVFGTFAIPKNIFQIPELPKTRSGKILRRLLKQLLDYNDKKHKIIDLSTMLNPKIIPVIKREILRYAEN